MKLLSTNDWLRRRLAMDPDIEPMAGGGESLIGDDYCPLCTHLASQHHAEIDALRARIAELEARLSLAEKVCEAAENYAKLHFEHAAWDAMTTVTPNCVCQQCCRMQVRAALAAWREGK